MKKIHYIIIIASVFFVGFFTNYPSQSIINWVFNLSDSTINVRLKSGSGASVVSSILVADTMTQGQSHHIVSSGAASGGDTITWSMFFNLRYKFSVLCNSDTTRIFRFNHDGTLYDSSRITTGQTYTTDYLDPRYIVKTVIMNSSNATDYIETGQGM